jgi:hypothetical protein
MSSVQLFATRAVVVMSLPKDALPSDAAYEVLYGARCDMENRTNEMRLLADRTSAPTMRPHLRLCLFSSVAYMLMTAPRRAARAANSPGRRQAARVLGGFRGRLLNLNRPEAHNVARNECFSLTPCPIAR